MPILHRLGRFGLVDAAAEQAAVQGEATRVDLAPRYLRLRIGALSGGNQQKALIGRVLLSGARHLVLFDPTRGVDVGTKAVIYDVIRDFCDRGGSALLYSTELSELVQLVDRCLVIYRGCHRGARSSARTCRRAAGGTRGGRRHSMSTAISPTMVPPTLRRRLLGDGTTPIILILVVLAAVFASTQSDALTLSVLTDIGNDSLPLALAAAGGSLVVLTRGFDLSVAGVVSLTNVAVAVVGGNGAWGALEDAAIALGIGAVVGAVNGTLVAYFGLQSIALTLASMIACSGAALLILDAPGGTVSDFMSNAMVGDIGPVPVALVIALAVLAIWQLLRRTDWGVNLYGTGADETAAMLAGVPVRRIKLMAYVLAGMSYGLAGFMLTGLTSTGTPNIGDPYLLLVFAAIALGGTSFAGGRGGVAGRCSARSR